MPQRIRKAVFPAAGLGTRFLTATKASPKEMLPLVDKLDFLIATVEFALKRPDLGPGSPSTCGY